MKFFTDIVTGGIDKIISSAGEAADRLFTSDEERMKAQMLIDQAKSDMQLELGKQALEYDREVTERWKSDNEHAITRLVRPVSFAIMMFMFLVMVVGDGNFGGIYVDVLDATGAVIGTELQGAFTIKEAYLPIIESTIQTMIFAYFGSRGGEKIAKSVWGKKS